MIEFKLENEKQLRELFNPTIVDKALNTSINKTAQKTRTFISKEVRKEWNIKARDISQTVKIRKLSDGRLIVYQGRRASLMKFSPTLKNVSTSRGKRIGVSVKVKKKSGKKLVKHGFAGFGNSGNFMLFKRQGKDRLPARRLTGPAVAQMVGVKEVENDVIAFVTKEQDVQFESAMNFWIKKQTGIL